MTGSRPDPDQSHPEQLDPTELDTTELDPTELDPTGIRSLLANLPAPGPMPEDLVTRIALSLEREQQRRSGGAAGAPETDGPAGSPLSAPTHTHSSPAHGAAGEPGGNVVSLSAERERRRPGRTVLWLGGAAAVAMVATLSVNQLTDGGGDAGVSAQVPAADAGKSVSDAGAEAGAGDDAGSDADAGAEDGESAFDDSQEAATGGDEGLAPPAAPAPGESPIWGGSADEGTPPSLGEEAEDAGGEATGALSVFTAAGSIELTSTTWGDQVSDWLDATPERGLSSWGSHEVLTCVGTQALPVSDARQLLVSDVTWDQEPGMLLLVAQKPVGATAWVVNDGCTEVISGPLTLNR